MTLQEAQAIARALPPNPARLARAVAQSLRAEGYLVTDEQSLEALHRILDKHA